MASTRRIFQSTKASVTKATVTKASVTKATSTKATVTGARQQNRTEVVSRSMGQQTARLERQQARQQRNQERAAQTSYYDGEGRYRTVGADGGYRPQGSVSSGGVPVGGLVPANGGLMGGMPAGGGGVPLTQFNELEIRVAQVAYESGWQVGTADPNAEDAIVPPRYPQDRYLETISLTLYYWKTTDPEDMESGRWVAIATAKEERTIGIQGPAIQQYPIVAANDAPRLYLGLSTLNRNNDGTEASAGLADVLVNGEIAVPGTTEIPVDAYVALNVTDVGTGDIMAASVYARLI